jgi:long-chain acyl-CoA synthetase
MTLHDPVLNDFERLLGDRPEHVMAASPDRAMRAREVDELARGIGRRLPEGLAGRTVGFVCPNGPAFLAGWVALRRAGAVPVLFDAATPIAARQRSAGSLGAGGLLSADGGWADADEFQWTPCAPEAVEIPAGTALVKLTSGSTGAPRGIAVSAEALAADDDQLVSTMGLEGTERALAAVALSHSYGFSSLALPALRRGVTLVMPEEGSGPLAPLRAARLLGATFFPTVPAWLSALVRLQEPPSWPEPLKRVISAGAPLPAATALLFHCHFGIHVHVFYGASECGGITYDRRGDAAMRGTVGTPVDGVSIRIGADGRPTIRSAAVAIGALPLPDPDLHDGVFVTGDLASWEGDELRLCGRADDLVIVRGKNVDPREVEAVLRGLVEVEDVAVLGLAADSQDGEPTLRAVIVCAPNTLSYDAVTRHCRERLADHEVPRSIVFVEMLPRNARGKLDREALARLTA